MLEEGVEVERLKDGWHILRQTRQPNLALSIRKKTRQDMDGLKYQIW